MKTLFFRTKKGVVRNRTGLFLGFLPYFLIVAVKAVDVIPDGTTTTSTSIGGAGQTIISIAPVTSGDNNGVSHNKYTTFNVGAPGVQLDNRGINARTILNEVTSTNPSLIEGKLEVLGRTANVFLVNPNGITVNGGSFVNTAGVSLSTGQVTFVPRSVSGLTVKDIRLTNGQVGEGEITIGASGLTGDFSILDLVSRKITIQGNISTTSSEPTNTIQLIAGKSIVNYDATKSTSDVTQNWSKPESNGGTNTGVVLIDITRPASLNAGRIALMVNDDGAGVRSSGTMASVGDFIIKANGDVELLGGTIASSQGSFAAEKNDPAGSALTWTSSAGTAGKASVSAETGLVIAASAVNATDTSLESSSGKTEIGITGATPTSFIFKSDLGVGEIKNSNGSVGIFAKGKDLDLTGVNVSSSQPLKVEANSLILAGTGTGASYKSTSMSGFEINLDLTGAMQVKGADLIAGTDLTIKTASLNIEGVNQGGDDYYNPQVQAVNGGLLIETTAGNITNKGGSIQGKTRIASNADSKGGVTLKVAGDFLNQSYDNDDLGIVFASDDDLSITTTGKLTNTAGRLISNKAVDLQITGALENKIDLTDTSLASKIVESSRPSFFFFKKKTKSIRYTGGAYSGQLAYIISGKGMTIQAGSISNSGGEIDANGGDLTINTDSLFQKGFVIGEANLESNSSFLRNTYQGKSNMQFLGGSINGSKDISITTTTSLENNGKIMALGDLSITSPIIKGESQAIYTLQRFGYSNPVAGQEQKLFRKDQGDEFIAGGKLTLTTTSPVEMNGGSLQGASVITPGGVTWIRQQVEEKPEPAKKIGLSQRFFGF